MACLVGCQPGIEAYFPTSTRQTWTYHVRDGFLEQVSTVRVKRGISVYGSKGIELQGGQNSTRFVWKDKNLYLERFAGGRLNPPAAILLNEMPKSKKEAVTRSYNCWAEVGGAVAEHASLNITQRYADIPYRGKYVRTVESTVVLDTPQKQIELVTNFLRGVGIIRQQQRTNGNLDAALDLIETS
ncbi:MAG: hypothetical protein JSS72_03525 [Armatimonadetes bacterium]|nr:hypothetical protein [Armatimonadota bacterium]